MRALLIRLKFETRWRSIAFKMPLNCKDEQSKTLMIKSPIGDLELESCHVGVHKLRLVKCRRSTCDHFEPDESITVENANGGDESLTDVEKSTISWLKSYFEKSFEKTSIQPPICHLEQNNTDDSSLVKMWQTLRGHIPSGDTITYSDLAVKSGLTQKHGRLAGRAMSSNPTILLVPCHRVLPKSGDTIGSYSGDGGSSVKEWLLKHEKETSN